MADPKISELTSRASPAGTDEVAVRVGSSNFRVTLANILALASGAVTSVFGRTGAVTAQSSDYDASQIDNDSGVSGAMVSDALDTLDSSKAATGHNHDASYAALSHNHDSDYADINHNHDSDYADINHNHDADYADISHNHDSDYMQPDQAASISKNHYFASSAISHSASHTINLDDNPHPVITVGGNTTVDLNAGTMRQGASHLITFVMDGTGGYTVSFNGTRFTGTPTIDNTANARSMVVFVIDDGVGHLRTYEAES